MKKAQKAKPKNKIVSILLLTVLKGRGHCLRPFLFESSPTSSAVIDLNLDICGLPG
ncbi:hypothetical protein [Martelella mediterranea]|uniref:Uncharacterized protein n=1 Tax=Martelella mediterranea TaxID=293089 RepID=A0A4R3NUZ2_9HYPH|nr:hypothetical protein [Martelella mediterranea]TCT40192.1 hypothetical protein EDC90_101044 [Martelella mediterranea]